MLAASESVVDSGRGIGVVEVLSSLISSGSGEVQPPSMVSDFEKFL